MNPDTTTFADRFDRFVRWFFSASPTAIVAPPLPREPKVARRAESLRPVARLQAHHAGPVRVTAKAKA